MDLTNKFMIFFRELNNTNIKKFKFFVTLIKKYIDQLKMILTKIVKNLSKIIISYFLFIILNIY